MLNRLSYGIQQAKQAYNGLKVSKLHLKHQGERIYILGAGPELNRLTDRQLKILSTSTTIGVNCVQYKLPLKYFLSAYPLQIILAKGQSNCEQIIHIRSKYNQLFNLDVLTMRRKIFQESNGLNDYLDWREPYLYTKMNVVLAATHLASIMGANEIVYLGVEQQNKIHFYDEVPQLREKILYDVLHAEGNDTLFTADHPYATRAHLANALRTPIDKNAPFFSASHTDTFSSYFTLLRKRGIQFFCANEETVVHHAGAEVTDNI